MAHWGARFGFVLDHLDDIESDLSAFHRIPFGTMLDLPASVFFPLAERLPAYAGVMQARALAERESTSQPSPATTSPASPARSDTKTVPSDMDSLKRDPVLSQVIGFGG